MSNVQGYFFCFSFVPKHKLKSTHNKPICWHHQICPVPPTFIDSTNICDRWEWVKKNAIQKNSFTSNTISRLKRIVKNEQYLPLHQLMFSWLHAWLKTMYALKIKHKLFVENEIPVRFRVHVQNVSHFHRESINSMATQNARERQPRVSIGCGLTELRNLSSLW